MHGFLNDATNLVANRMARDQQDLLLAWSRAFLRLGLKSMEVLMFTNERYDASRRKGGRKRHKK